MTIKTIQTAIEKAEEARRTAHDMSDYLEEVEDLVKAAEQVDLKAEPLDHPARGSGVWIPRATFDALAEAYQAVQ